MISYFRPPVRVQSDFASRTTANSVFSRSNLSDGVGISNSAAGVQDARPKAGNFHPISDGVDGQKTTSSNVVVSSVTGMGITRRHTPIRSRSRSSGIHRQLFAAGMKNMMNQKNASKTNNFRGQKLEINHETRPNTNKNYSSEKVCRVSEVANPQLHVPVEVTGSRSSQFNVSGRKKDSQSPNARLASTLSSVSSQVGVLDLQGQIGLLARGTGKMPKIVQRNGRPSALERIRAKQNAKKLQNLSVTNSQISHQIGEEGIPIDAGSNPLTTPYELTSRKSLASITITSSSKVEENVEVSSNFSSSHRSSVSGRGPTSGAGNFIDRDPDLAKSNDMGCHNPKLVGADEVCTAKKTHVLFSLGAALGCASPLEHERRPSFMVTERLTGAQRDGSRTNSLHDGKLSSHTSAEVCYGVPKLGHSPPCKNEVSVHSFHVVPEQISAPLAKHEYPKSPPPPYTSPEKDFPIGNSSRSSSVALGVAQTQRTISSEPEAKRRKLSDAAEFSKRPIVVDKQNVFVRSNGGTPPLDSSLRTNEKSCANRVDSTSSRNDAARKEHIVADDAIPLSQYETRNDITKSKTLNAPTGGEPTEIESWTRTADTAAHPDTLPAALQDSKRTIAITPSCSSVNNVSTLTVGVSPPAEFFACHGQDDIVANATSKGSKSMASVARDSRDFGSNASDRLQNIEPAKDVGGVSAYDNSILNRRISDRAIPTAMPCRDGTNVSGCVAATNDSHDGIAKSFELTSSNGINVIQNLNGSPELSTSIFVRDNHDSSPQSNGFADVDLAQQEDPSSKDEMWNWEAVLAADLKAWGLQASRPVSDGALDERNYIHSPAEYSPILPPSHLNPPTMPWLAKRYESRFTQDQLHAHLQNLQARWREVCLAVDDADEFPEIKFDLHEDDASEVNSESEASRSEDSEHSCSLGKYDSKIVGTQCVRLKTEPRRSLTANTNLPENKSVSRNAQDVYSELEEEICSDFDSTLDFTPEQSSAKRHQPRSQPKSIEGNHDSSKSTKLRIDDSFVQNSTGQLASEKSSEKYPGGKDGVKNSRCWIETEMSILSSNRSAKNARETEGLPSGKIAVDASDALIEVHAPCPEVDTILEETKQNRNRADSDYESQGSSDEVEYWVQPLAAERQQKMQRKRLFVRHICLPNNIIHSQGPHVRSDMFHHAIQDVPRVSNQVLRRHSVHGVGTHAVVNSLSPGCRPFSTTLPKYRRLTDGCLPIGSSDTCKAQDCTAIVSGTDSVGDALGAVDFNSLANSTLAHQLYVGDQPLALRGGTSDEDSRDSRVDLMMDLHKNYVDQLYFAHSAQQYKRFKSSAIEDLLLVAQDRTLTEVELTTLTMSTPEATEVHMENFSILWTLAMDTVEILSRAHNATVESLAKGIVCEFRFLECSIMSRICPPDSAVCVAV